MRNTYASRSPRKRRRHSACGCGGCLGKFIFLLVMFSLLIYFGYQVFESLGIKNQILQLRYPVKYPEIVEKYADEFQLDEAMIYAIIRTESRFDPYAVSKTNARGLMQVQEETAYDCVKALKMENFSPDLLFDPDINVRLGCYYFSKLLKKYDGNLTHAIAAYNGGPGNVDKWLKDAAYIDETGVLTHIPFQETRNYVTRVKEACEMYRTLYPISQ